MLLKLLPITFAFFLVVIFGSHSIFVPFPYYLASSITYCLINGQECFIGFRTTGRSSVVFDSIKKKKGRHASSLNGFKNIPQKACPLRVQTLELFRFASFNTPVFHFAWDFFGFWNCPFLFLRTKGLYRDCFLFIILMF